MITGVIKDKGCWVLKSMMVMVMMMGSSFDKLLFQSMMVMMMMTMMMVMMMVIILGQPLVPKHGISPQEEARGDSMIVFPRRASTSLSFVDQGEK